MNDRLTIAAMLLATTAQRRQVFGDDVTSAVKCADDLIRAEAGFDSRFMTINVGTVHVDDFAFQVGDRCECRDHVPRTISILGDDGRPDRYNCGTSKINIDQFARLFQLFHGATVYRDGKAVAVLSTDPATKKPEPFEFQVGDVVIIPDVCGRIITNTDPLRWTGGGRLDSSELDDHCKEFARQLRKGAVWRGGELVREAVA